MEKSNGLEKLRLDLSDLFGRVFKYNTELLYKCNDHDYEPTFEEIFDFYITSHAMTFLKNFYYNYIESPAMLLNIRCIYEGIAIKAAYEAQKLNELNLELLKKQDALIEYNEYKNFSDIYESFMIPKDIEEKYNDAVSFYKDKLCSLSDEEVKKIVNSSIPFLCNSKISYHQIICENLGEDAARYYSLLSVLIHPNSNNSLSNDMLIHISMNAFLLLKVQYKDLPIGDGNLKYYEMILLTSADADEFSNLIKAECAQFEKIENEFKDRFDQNYVTDTFFKISMTIQEMMLDTIFSLTEQVKGKWKVMLELLAGFYEVYLNNDNVPDSFKLLEYYTEISKRRTCEDEEEVNRLLDLAYKTYINKYPNGIDFNKFSSKFTLTCGFTIDEEGKVKSITKLVNQLCDLFDEDVNGFKSSNVLKLNYVEAQMVSHANGYLWYANTGAWADVYGVFTSFNCLITFICMNMSESFKKAYAHTKDYKDKKTSNVLKQAAKFIKNNTKALCESLMKRDGVMPGTPQR